MSLIREKVVFDPSGDVFLLLERTDITPTDDVTPHQPTGDAPAHDVPADDAPTDGISIDQSVIEISKQLNDADGDPSAKLARREVELQVSSKHLSLASKVLCHCLEGLPIGDKDVRTIPLPHDDLGAMQILLNIIHGLTRRVPRRVDVSVLSRVVVLIDKYEFHETAEVLTDIWLESLQPTILQDHQTLAANIFICWVLKKPSEYNILTKKAIWETSCGLEDEDGCVPYWIISEIQSRRQAILSEVLDTLSKLLDRFCSSQRQCYQDDNCDPLALGKLIRGLRTFELYPIREPSEIKTSIQDLFSAIRSIDLSPFCAVFSKKDKRTRGRDEDHVCVHMDKDLTASLLGIEERISGLELRDDAHKDQFGTNVDD
ncbi:hypothetical protein AYO20_10177 [Fonsecaea nubica]|uniref:BTB domain-containing protein n=1 Tax=Fonsecaea nubica TaxID=856822 RepID=A0A178C8M1_9EURO|nr:hypothetical protein AYO20_10177 [Fonsecaea nubica]OAL26300.1 hypothetical protein AYO20_10177 [Fonsecaea nubica]